MPPKTMVGCWRTSTIDARIAAASDACGSSTSRRGYLRQGDTDVIGAEVGGAFKSVVALLPASPEGSGFGAHKAQLRQALIALST
jgi:hypothetical protein